MATAPGNSSNDDLSNFGANDWLIEEMFEAWKKDPNSVDTSWREFFDKRAGQATPQAAPATAPAPAPAPETPQSGGHAGHTPG